MAEGKKIAEAHIDIVANMGALRADLDEVKSKFAGMGKAGKGMSGKLTAVFTGITAGIGVMKLAWGAVVNVVKLVANVIGKVLKAAFWALKKVAKTVFAVIKFGWDSAVAGIKKFIDFSKSAIKVQAKFGQSMARVGALTNTVGTKDFDSLRKRALDLGKATEFSAGEAADAMGNFAMAGFKTGEILKATGPTLDFASANQLQLAEASDIAARVMGAMQISADKTRMVMDALTHGATKTNQNVQDLGEAFKNAGSSAAVAGADLADTTAALMVMADQGQRGSEAGSALKQVFLKMPSKNVGKMFKGLGIAMTDAVGGMRPMPDLIDELNSAIAGKGEFEKLNMLVEAFGTRAGPGMIKLLNAGGDAWRSYAEDVRAASGTTERIAGIQRDTLATSFKIVKSASDDVKIALGDVFEPFIKSSNKRFVKVLNFIADKIREWTPIVQEKLGELLTWIDDNFMNAFEVAAATVLLFYRDIVRGYDALAAVFSGVGGGAAGFLTEFFGMDKVPAGAGLVQKVFLGITNAFTKLQTQFEVLWVRLKFTFKDWLDALMINLKIFALKAGDTLSLFGDSSDEQKMLQDARRMNKKSFGIIADAAIRRVENAGQAVLDERTANINENLFSGDGAGDEAAAQAKNLRDAFENALGSDTNAETQADAAEEVASTWFPDLMDSIKDAVQKGGGAATNTTPAGFNPVGASGTISTVFGQMKVGITEEVKLLSEMVRLTKIIAEGTDASGAMS